MKSVRHVCSMGFKQLLKVRMQLLKVRIAGGSSLVVLSSETRLSDMFCLTSRGKLFRLAILIMNMPIGIIQNGKELLTNWFSFAKIAHCFEKALMSGITKHVTRSL